MIWGYHYFRKHPYRSSRIDWFVFFYLPIPVAHDSPLATVRGTPKRKMTGLGSNQRACLGPKEENIKVLGKTFDVSEILLTHVLY